MSVLSKLYKKIDKKLLKKLLEKNKNVHKVYRLYDEEDYYFDLTERKNWYMIHGKLEL